MTTSTVSLYIARHGRTMFNALHRTQGWSDTPLTPDGAETVEMLGYGLQDIPFVAAYSSDSGRAIETARIALSKHKMKTIPHMTEPRIREWCFGSLEGGYDDEMYQILPRALDYHSFEDMLANPNNYEAMANAIVAADTANWAEPYAEIRDRIWNGFTDIAKRTQVSGGGNVLIVSHGLTISNFLSLIEPNAPLNRNLINASISRVDFLNGEYKIQSINDTSYIAQGKKLMAE